MIVFNNTAVASNPAAGPGVVRRTLLTDENVEEAGIRFDCLTLGADASFRFEPSARSMVWCQMLEGDAKLKTVYTDDLSDRHSVLLPPAFGATLSTERRQSFWQWLIHQKNARGVSLLRPHHGRGAELGGGFRAASGTAERCQGGRAGRMTAAQPVRPQCLQIADDFMLRAARK